MPSTGTIHNQQQITMTHMERIANYVNRKWLLIFSFFFGLYVGLPFVPPVFMQIGWEGAAKAIYFIYSFLCHQLPQRSYFFFGVKSSYSLSEIQAAWVNTIDPFVLRQFIGNPDLGWKVAWSDRMVSMYTSILIFTWIWRISKSKLKSFPIWGFLLLIVPMAVDGITHMLSDLSGIGQGFRDNNAWLVQVTNNAFNPMFYAGDALGSFNSWMRILTGILFGLGIVLFTMPILQEFSAISHKRYAIKKQQTDLKRSLIDR